MKRKKSGTSQYPGGRQTNNRVLFARYSRVIRALAAISVSYSVRRITCLFGVYPLDIHVYSVLNNYILHSETAFWASCYSEAPYSALF